MSSKSTVEQSHWYPPWAPRIWTGMRPRNYYRLLADNQFQIDPSRYPMTGLVAMWSLFNSGLASAQWLLKDRAIAETRIEQPPIFIIGHWRSGTTLMHELISQDRNLTFPTTYDVAVPHHFLISSFVIKSLMRLLMPKRRPFDDMSIDVDSPQEDDFAFMVMGAPTHYVRLGFPNQSNPFCRWLDSQNLSANETKKLATSIEYFFKALTLRTGKQLVLKSPPHTGRISLLRKLFPTAKFVHLSRHPHRIVPSTMRMWRINDEIHAFQKPRYSDAELLDHITVSQQILYRAYERDRGQLAENQLVEISFEQLTADPLRTVAQIYEKLELDGVDEVVASTKTYFELRKDHRKNIHDVEPYRERIDQDWENYSQLFGYSCDREQSNVA